MIREVPKLGEILIEQGATTRHRVLSALEEQARNNKPLGQLLLDRGDITRKQLNRALRHQFMLMVTMGLISFGIALAEPAAASGLTGKILLQGIVPPAAGLLISQRNSIQLPNDLRIPATSGIARLTEVTNITGKYVVTIESQNAGRLGNSVLVDKTGTLHVPYTLRYDNADLTFKDGKVVLPGHPAAGSASADKELSVFTKGTVQLASGVYSDALRINIVSR